MFNRWNDWIRSAAIAVLAAWVLAGCSSGLGSRPAGAQVGSTTNQERPPFGTAQYADLSPRQHDRLLGASFDSSNRLYASGWVAKGGDHVMAVSRYGSDGRLDRNFGDRGVATVNIARGGKAAEQARSVVVQASRMVVVAGPVEHDPAAPGDAAEDTDVAVARFDKDGRLDRSFGTDGTVRLDLSIGVADGESYRGDTSSRLIRLADDKLLLLAAQVSPGGTDLELAVVRLTTDGVLDATFGRGGLTVVSAPWQGAVSPGGAVELADGSIVLSGSASSGDTAPTVLFRLTAAGRLDPTFGTGGTARPSLQEHVPESLGVGVLGNDRRDLLVLPSGASLVVGSGKRTSRDADGMVVKLQASGAPDTRFAPGGHRLYDLGGSHDSFSGLAMSPDESRVAVVGHSAGEAGGSNDDDGAVLWLEP